MNDVNILNAKNYLSFKDALKNSNCQSCDLSHSRTQIVVDRGNPKAKVVFIGEAPGKNEDEKGLAFIGRSGKLLDEMFSETGFSTDKDAIIINIVKCRPPDNRAPKKSEVSKCLPFLHKQLALINPDFILLFGATAVKHLFPQKKDIAMKNLVGKFFSDTSYPQAKFIVLYHPAFILRNMNNKPIMRKHIQIFISQIKALG